MAADGKQPQNPLYLGLAKPAQRALADAGLATSAQLARRTEGEIAALHGMGPNAIKTLTATLAKSGLRFAKRT